MQRVNKSEINTNQALQAKLQNLSILVTRANWAAQLGQQYGGDRDVYQALGYPLEIKYKEYNARYQRQDMAKAVIDRPVKVTWEGDLNIVESKDDKETGLEKAWIEMRDRLSLKEVFSRVDKLAGIGCYAVLVLGFDDVKTKEDFKIPVLPTRKLLYVKPICEESAVINTWDEDTKSVRYGLPVTYSIKITDPSSNSSMDIVVHYTRVIHVVDDILESEVHGVPRLQVVYNRLMDLEKLVGGSAEMFWRGARPGFQGKVDDNYQMTPAMEEDLINQIDEYEHNLRRMLVNKGITYESLQQQVADPKSHVDIQIQMISAVTGIPKRILTGSERGELSSKEDKSEWNSYVKGRREDFAELRVIRPFIDVCIKYGCLPKPSTEKYKIEWSDLFAKSELEMVTIGKERATALKEYTMNPMAEMVMPMNAFFEFCLGLSSEQIELIKEMQEVMPEIEPILKPEEEEIIDKEKEIVKE